ncbi:hypothetical protein [Vibrio gallicus]|uniref:hypothetical protein n=1 Tax=Vibrio gallicus TaxID=190897 RepID=UPI0021C28C0E|nr:hypothetical protein [Vibrio gallicus]
MRKLTCAALAVAATFSGTAFAENPNVMSNFNYDYFEARIGMAPLTFGAGFNKSIHPNAHFVATADSEFDSDFLLRTGLGFHAPVTNWADITGQMLARVADNRRMDTKVGMEVNLGWRQWLGPQFEVGGDVGYVTMDGRDDWIGSAYGRFHATELFSIGLAGKLNDFYGDQFMLTTRFLF